MIIVEIYSPAVDASYDFQIDEDISAGEAARSAAEMIARKNGSEEQEECEAALYDTVHERELDQGRSLKENGIISGMKLLLV